MFATALLFCSAAQAKTWRINNDPTAKADFLSINDAMSSTEVLDGDVLYLDPGCRLPQQSVSKSVTIIGTGYNLTEAEEAMVAGINIQTSNIKFTGVNVSGKIRWLSPHNNITIERCKAQELDITYETCLGVKIIGCYIVGNISGGGSGAQSGSNTVIRNSIVLGYIEHINGGIVTNNVIIHDSRNESAVANRYPLRYIQYSAIKNNIIINTSTYKAAINNVITNYSNYTIYNTAVTDYNTICNNVLSTDADHAWADFPTNKFIGAKVEDIFVNEGNQEEKYQLKEGSAAIGYGTNGVDCGAFDGMYPYVLCGRPQFVPYIYEAQIPTTTDNGKLNITLKIKTQNE